MELLKLAGVGLIGAMLAMTLREQKHPLGAAVSMAAGLVVLLLAVDALSGVFEGIWQLANLAHLESALMQGLIKIVGMAFILEIAVHLIRDAGEASLAARVEMGGRILIVALSMPALETILQLVIQVMP